ncbi:MAG: 4Fe-4S dicluster domain-containing protein [Bacillota bacterium]|nr:iron-sulfur protein [Bacillota bacterium]HWR55325.1 4Fe-4S dicluster domain-containing protein [Negativicutes bacterium]
MEAGENRFIYVDMEKCLGCKSCELACALSHANTDLYTAVLQGKHLQPRTSVVLGGDLVTPMQCRQCENAPCALVCPVGAIYQGDGLIKLKESVCIGCKLCSMVCPFGVIRMKIEVKKLGTRLLKKGKALKCDLCIEKAGRVEETACACIQACPTKAMYLVDLEEHRKRMLETRGKEAAQARTRLGQI